MAIFDDLQALYDNGWDASFDYNGQVCGIFPNSVYDIVVIVADNEYRASSFDDLISLQIEGKTLLEIMSEVEVQYG
ncbi:16S rRNA processing protein RimM [Streptococcus mitis]|uniref:16S rRNA processing protein RimM n=1 Tax=Streptococcus mitis TaxID=28037 RepID=UPI0021B5D159|nr:16S rRNA processing protein RimM [Streptococcus mitis]